MNHWRIIASVIVLIGVFSTHCTIEKRLYNRGYHVEFKSNHHQESVTEENPLNDTVDLVLAEETEKEDIVLTTRPNLILINPESFVSDGEQMTIMQQDSSEDEPKKPYTEQRKKKILTGLAIPMMACVGLGTVMIFKSAAATGSWVAGLGYALGFLFFSFIFLVLFIIFLIFLIRKTDEKKDELNNPEHRTVSE